MQKIQLPKEPQMSFKFSKKSTDNLKGVSPQMVDVVSEALKITKCDFIVLEGLRLVLRQLMLVKTGKSKTMKSKHLQQPDGFGHAVDLLPCRKKTNEEMWKDIEGFQLVADAMKIASEKLSIPIRWGADWNCNGITRAQGDENEKFVDCPHFELVS